MKIHKNFARKMKKKKKEKESRDNGTSNVANSSQTL